MKKSGKTIRVETMDTSWAKEFHECVAIFEGVGWFEFFQKIDGFNLELSYIFALGLDKNTVAIESLKFKLTRELIVESTGIAATGEPRFKKVPVNPKNPSLGSTWPTPPKDTHA